MALKISFPSISSKLPPDVQQFLQRVREAFHKGGMVTEDDLLAAGIASRTPSGSLVPGSVDYSTPPAPTGVTASGTITAIFLQWDNPDDIGWANFSYAEVWRSEENNLGTAVLLGTSDFFTYVDSVEPASTFYYWVRFVSRVDIAGPFHGTSGVMGSTNDSPDRILDILSGSITASQLHQTLGQRIDLIDGTGTGSVNARVSAEASARAQAILDEASARAGGDSALQQQINILSAASSGDLSELVAAVESEATARASADSAEATARETLATQLRGSYTGTDVSQVTTGLVYSERTARSTADAAMASDISTIGAQVTNNYNTLNSAIQTEATTRATADSTNATAITNVQSQVTMGTKGGLLPSGFDTKANWSHLVAGSPSTIATSTVLQVVTDNELGVCGETVLDASYRLTTKGVLPAISGRKYRVTAVVKVASLPADGSFGLHVAAHSLDINYAQVATAVYPAATVINTAGTTHTLTGVFSDVASTGVIAWQSGARYLRFALRLGSTETTGPTVRVQYLKVEDVTDVETLTAAIQTEAATRANADGTLFAQYAVRLDVGGKVIGFGLMSDGPSGEADPFEIRADRFIVAAPSGQSVASSIPFVVDTVSGKTVIDGAVIKTASIKTAAIEDAAITNAKIVDLSASKLTSGEIVGKDIELGTGGVIRCGQTAFNTGYGFWLGMGIDGYARFSLGTPDGPGLDYDESTGELNFRGIMELKSGSTIGGISADYIGGWASSLDNTKIDGVNIHADSSIITGNTVPATGNKYSVLSGGDISFYDYYGGAFHEFKTLKKTVYGSAVNGATVNLGYFRDTPKVILSQNNLMSYHAGYAQTQTFVLNPLNLRKVGDDYLFDVQCQLHLASNYLEYFPPSWSVSGVFPGYLEQSSWARPVFGMWGDWYYTNGYPIPVAQVRSVTVDCWATGNVYVCDGYFAGGGEDFGYYMIYTTNYYKPVFQYALGIRTAGGEWSYYGFNVIEGSPYEHPTTRGVTLSASAGSDIVGVRLAVRGYYPPSPVVVVDNTGSFGEGQFALSAGITKVSCSLAGGVISISSGRANYLAVG